MHQYVPGFILQKAQRGEVAGALQSAVLFMDISGFTAMTQSLMQHGRAGAEVLADLINQTFEPIIAVVYAQGGFITGFAGDAFTALFPAEVAAEAVQMSLAAALRIRELVAEHPHQATAFGEFTLAVRLALAYGVVEWGILGLPAHKTYFFRGPALQDSVEAANQAKSGEVVLSAGFLHLIRERAEVQALEKGYVRLLDIPRRLDLSGPPPFIPEPEVGVAGLFFPLPLWRLAIQGEFRQVAVAFLSFRGLDSFAVFDQFVCRVLEAVQRYGGHFCELDFGDKGGLALLYFGAPQAHENDVERALSCLLALRGALADVTGLDWRAGVSYGLVYTGLVGSALRSKYTALGTEVNFAARLMFTANWGQVLVSPSVARLPGFEFETVGMIQYKGFPQPLATYSLVGRKSSPEALFERPMLGRENELKQLLDFARSCHLTARPGAALIYGGPGVGKSRLAYALSEQFSPGTVTWIKAQTDQILRQTFNPFVYALRRYFEQSSQVASEVNLAAFVTQFERLHLACLQVDAPLAHELERTRSLLGALLDLYWPGSLYEQLESSDRYSNTVQALAAWLQAQARLQPLVLELADAHWLDDGSRAVLRLLAFSGVRLPLLLLLTARYSDEGAKVDPGLPPDFPILTLDLNTLAPETLCAIAEDILGGKLEAGFLSWLLQKSQGNPFYLQQILYYLQEKGGLLPNARTTEATEIEWQLQQAEFELPATISAILMARLDRLNQEVKEVVQTAAVVGREFEVQILAQALRSGDILAVVQRAEAQQIWKALWTLHYIFSHTLLRDAAYEMQLQTRLRSLHRIVAEAYLLLYAADPAPYYGELAYHFGQAGDLDQERRYCLLAAEQAVTHHKHQDALHWRKRALELTPAAQQEECFQLWLGIESSYAYLAQRPEQQQALVELESRAPALGVQSQASVALLRAQMALETTDYPAAVAAAEQAVSLAVSIEDISRQAEAHALWGESLFRRSSYPEAEEHFLFALEQARRAGAVDLQGYILWNLGHIQTAYHHNFSQTRDYYRQAIAAHRASGNRKAEAKAIDTLGITANKAGDEDPLPYHLEALAIFRQLGYRYGEANALNNLGIVFKNQGDLPAAVECFQRSLAMAREMGNRQREGWVLMNLGGVMEEIGEYETARQYFEQGLAPLRQIEDRYNSAVLLYNLSCLVEIQGRYNEAYELAQQALQNFQAIGQRIGASFAQAALAQALAGLGRREQARQAYAELVGLQRELNLPRELGDSLATLALLEQTDDLFEQARVHIEESLTLLSSLESLRNSPQAQRVYWNCYQVLHSQGDDRAAAILETAYQNLQRRAALLPDAEMRRSYLENVPWPRALLAAWESKAAN